MALLFLLMAIPLTEIALFLVIGDAVGVTATLLCVIVTAIVGTVLLRHQGINTIQKAQTSMGRGEMPIDALFDGLCIFLSGAFLLTPGFLTDTLGLILLIPGTRAVLRKAVASRIVTQAKAGHMRSGPIPRDARTQARSAKPAGGRDPAKPIIDADFTEIGRDEDR